MEFISHESIAITTKTFVVCNVYCLRFILNDHKSLCMNGSASYAIMCCRIYLGDYLGQLVKVRTV